MVTLTYIFKLSWWYIFVAGYHAIIVVEILLKWGQGFLERRAMVVCIDNATFGSAWNFFIICYRLWDFDGFLKKFSCFKIELDLHSQDHLLKEFEARKAIILVKTWWKWVEWCLFMFFQVIHFPSWKWRKVVRQLPLMPHNWYRTQVSWP